MNFLPLVITFLFIFGAVSLSFVTSRLADKTEALAYQGRLHALRLAYNEVEDHRYNRIKQVPHDTTKNASLKTKPQSFHDQAEKKAEEKLYFRYTRMESVYSALNLAKLTEKDIDNDWLREKTIEYLKAMYGNATFIRELKDPDWARNLLDFLVSQQVKALKEKNKFLSLKELQPDGPLKEFYPKLIRGTNSFDLQTGRGYLPLEQCITFRQNHPKPVNIHYANPKLLIVFFGNDIFSQIQQEEWPQGCPRKKALYSSGYALRLDELRKLLGTAFDERMTRMIDDDYHPQEKHPKKGVDPKTFISAHVFEESSPE